MTDGPKQVKIEGAVGIADQDGTVMAETGFITGTEGMHPEEVRFSIAEQRGLDPEGITLPGENAARQPSAGHRAGRMSVAFSSESWNSSWDPGKKDDTEPGASDDGITYHQAG